VLVFEGSRADELIEQFFGADDDEDDDDDDRPKKKPAQKRSYFGSR